ncbi:MAG: hypothetical protein M1821_002087 [Bathelium mastoideum]|nr:MAG: hypothetical protein M1821_002087 [Bathelium mastoideum]KAI9692596.1 MAG: hypothetical protein M1822_006827 [Bathelium mastoideum]
MALVCNYPMILARFVFWICATPLAVHALAIADPRTLLAEWPFRSFSAYADRAQIAQHHGFLGLHETVAPPSPTPGYENAPDPAPTFNIFEDLHGALEVLQTRFFEVWLGTWPDAIDWTAAVMGTHLSGGLISLTRSLEFLQARPTTITSEYMSSRAQAVENEINKYFSQSVAYYFGENAFAIRTQAYDDMLWVVLGWLESVKFIDLHGHRHFPETLRAASTEPILWYGDQFKSSFAHRARIFYELASKGWDERLCGGGMVWNPGLAPYKNAITNELFIAAAVGMYLYFPGDQNNSPFLRSVSTSADHTTPVEPHDDKFLTTAVKAYSWLSSINMTNEQGLYVDGFHINGWGKNASIGTGECDVRNEMVYTYNQGVILSGLRGLWEGTGNISYLEDGHRLVRNVIAATGWSGAATLRSGGWSGLGRNGTLEDYCDSKGDCSQDSQGFKGIFFHHLTLFCEPLPREAMVPGKTYSASPAERLLHAQSCREYVPWIAHNADAALKTRNIDGVFGMWWGHGKADGPSEMLSNAPLPPTGAEDYRNTVIPLDNEWQRTNASTNSESSSRDWEFHGLHCERAPPPRAWINPVITTDNDANDRGRGRTAETQGSGVAVTRALWEFVHTFRHNA